MPRVWDNRGNLIGSIRRVPKGFNVYDRNSQPAGSVRPTGTYDKNGRKVTGSKEPGLLFNR